VFSDLFSRRRKQESPKDTGAEAPVYPTKALPKFLAAVKAKESPVLLDLGPVIGTNLDFFGERLGCKILVEDVFKDVDRHAREGTLSQLAGLFEQRFPQDAESIDGIVCWDLFDYLDKKCAPALAVQLARLLRPEGVLLGFFATHEPKPDAPVGFTRYVVVSDTSLQYRPYEGPIPKQRTHQNRDIQRMFEPLRIAEQFLLKSNAREVMLRKPAPGSPDAGL
jgi:hypothetical protein